MSVSPPPSPDLTPGEALELCRQGRHMEAAEQLAQQIFTRPADPEPRYWLYCALHGAGKVEQAAEVLTDARNLQAALLLRRVGVDMARLKQDRPYAAAVGEALYGKRLMGAASLALGHGLDLSQPQVATMLQYGLSLQHQGRAQEAVDVFTAAGELFQRADIAEFLIFALFHVPEGLRQVSQRSREWAARYADTLSPPSTTFANPPADGRPLRVGYVGPSFTGSQVSQFLLPVLEAHDARAVKTFLYSSNAETEPGLPEQAQKRSIAGLSDERVAELVREDQIDLLIDVWGHTAGSRLGVFARRPAPVQVAWINFVQTTGLKAMDYVIHADSMAAPEAEMHFVEEIWRIGEIMAPFRPLEGRPPQGPAPALRNGHVTFGCFNNPAKLSDATIAAWAAILRQRPNDRLVLKYSYFTDPVLQRVTQARFAAHGADPSQLEFRGESRGADYLREFQDIDLALDPSPCPGGTSTCDALSNGVPVLTLKGADFYSRIGLPGVIPTGVCELVADSWEDYVNRALDLTRSASDLDQLRRRVRQGFDNSAYRDEVGFTRRLEDTYREMFARWAAGRTKSAA